MAAALALQELEVKSFSAKGQVATLVASAPNLAMVDACVRGMLARFPIDVIVRPHPAGRYKLLISDMDSTMITCECIDELADFVGKKQQVADITARAMNGELEFEQTLAARVALLTGLPEATLQKCYNTRVKPMPGAKELLAAHKKAGGHSVLVSGGFTFFTSRVAALLGFDEHYGNTFDIENGKLTGKLKYPVLDKHAKLDILQSSCKKLGIAAQEVLAIGDGSNDLPMLLAAGLGVAYHAKPMVRQKAHARIDHGDLRALLPFIG